MNVYHVLKDGSRPKDIIGHIVRISDAGSAYRLVTKMNENIKEKNKSCSKLLSVK